MHHWFHNAPCGGAGARPGSGRAVSTDVSRDRAPCPPQIQAREPTPSRGRRDGARAARRAPTLEADGDGAGVASWRRGAGATTVWANIAIVCDALRRPESDRESAVAECMPKGRRP